MVKFAAVLIIVTWILGALGIVIYESTDNEWVFRKSPHTGICYEIRRDTTPLGQSESMSPVDDKYCEEK